MCNCEGKQEVVERPKIYHIVIEGHDEGQVMELFEEIQNKYSLYDNCVFEEASIEDTIIDYEEPDDNGDFRCGETGVLKCLTKEEYDKVMKR